MTEQQAAVIISILRCGLACMVLGGLAIALLSLNANPVPAGIIATFGILIAGSGVLVGAGVLQPSSTVS